MADFPVDWVAAGGGVLAYGAGQHAHFALPGDPFAVVSTLPFNKTILEALILGRYAFFSEEGLGLRLVDLGLPSQPVDLGFYPLSGTTFHLASWGNFLFVAGDQGVRVLEFSFPQPNDPPVNLMERGVIPIADPVAALAAGAGKLYVAIMGKGIMVLDVSDPLSPAELENLSTPLPIQSMALNGDRLYIAAGSEGLHVIDISTSGSPSTLATHLVMSQSLFLAGRLVYLSFGERRASPAPSRPNCANDLHGFDKG